MFYFFTLFDEVHLNFSLLGLNLLAYNSLEHMLNCQLYLQIYSFAWPFHSNLCKIYLIYVYIYILYIPSLFANEGFILIIISFPLSSGPLILIGGIMVSTSNPFLLYFIIRACMVTLSYITVICCTSLPLNIRILFTF